MTDAVLIANPNPVEYWSILRYLPNRFDAVAATSPMRHGAICQGVRNIDFTLCYDGNAFLARFCVASPTISFEFVSFDASFAILKLLSRLLLTRVYFREHTCFQSYDESCVTFTMRRKAMANAASVQSLKQITAQKNSPPVTQSSATNAGSASESNAQKTQHLVSFSQEEIDKKLT